MAHGQFSCSAAAFATSTSAKTAALVIAGSSVSPTLIGFDFSDDASLTTGAYKVELVSSTQAGAGTAGGSTVVKMGASQTTAVSTCGTSYSAEPTTLTVLNTWYIPAIGGVLPMLYPLGREWQVPVSHSYGIRVTAPSGTPNVCVNLYWEE